MESSTAIPISSMFRRVKSEMAVFSFMVTAAPKSSPPMKVTSAPAPRTVTPGGTVTGSKWYPGATTT